LIRAEDNFLDRSRIPLQTSGGHHRIEVYEPGEESVDVHVLGYVVLDEFFLHPFGFHRFFILQGLLLGLHHLPVDRPVRERDAAYQMLILPEVGFTELCERLILKIVYLLSLWHVQLDVTDVNFINLLLLHLCLSLFLS